MRRLIIDNCLLRRVVYLWPAVYITYTKKVEFAVVLNWFNLYLALMFVPKDIYMEHKAFMHELKEAKELCK